MDVHNYAEEGHASTKKEEDKEALDCENGEYNLNPGVCPS